MTRVRRLVAGAVVAGTLLIPFGISSAQPAAAYCEVRLVDDGGTGCPNTCQGTAGAVGKIMDKLDQEWNCLQ